MDNRLVVAMTNKLLLIRSGLWKYYHVGSAATGFGNTAVYEGGGLY